MNVLPTSDGELCIRPESGADWMQLELICEDAGHPSRLAESFSELMEPESGWGEYVAPGLESTFSGQCREVATAIENARQQDGAAIFITARQAETWYGAINQARLALEARYQLDALDDNPEGSQPEVRSAFHRSRFYLFLQSMLLEFVMEV